MRRLSRAEVAEIRTRILVQQKFCCAICGCKLKGKSRGGATLDHNHETGVIRGVLCRSCNGGEGKVKSAATRYGGGRVNWQPWLRALLGYLSFHSISRTTYTHPTHLTEEEKRLKRNAKARKKRRSGK